MAEREDLELQRGPAPEGSEKHRPKSGQQVPKWESKGEQQLPVYQSNRSLREPQLDRLFGPFFEIKQLRSAAGDQTPWSGSGHRSG